MAYKPKEQRTKACLSSTAFLFPVLLVPLLSPLPSLGGSVLEGFRCPGHQMKVPDQPQVLYYLICGEEVLSEKKQQTKEISPKWVMRGRGKGVSQHGLFFVALLLLIVRTHLLMCCSRLSLPPPSSCYTYSKLSSQRETMHGFNMSRLVRDIILVDQTRHLWGLGYLLKSPLFRLWNKVQCPFKINLQLIVRKNNTNFMLLKLWNLSKLHFHKAQEDHPGFKWFLLMAVIRGDLPACTS